MNNSKRHAKEYNMIKAAERVFGAVGFKNAKMEDIAVEAGITKVTLYSYFQSKENLYLGVTYHLLLELNDAIYNTVDKNRDKSGLEATMAIIVTFMEHCEDNFIAAETLLDYFSLMRKSGNNRNKALITEATQDSIYLRKLEDVQNIGFKLAAKEIIRGQEDGSVVKSLDPFVHTLLGWTTVIGYVKVINSAGIDAAPIFSVSVRDLRELALDMLYRELTKEPIAADKK